MNCKQCGRGLSAYDLQQIEKGAYDGPVCSVCRVEAANEARRAKLAWYGDREET